MIPSVRAVAARRLPWASSARRSSHASMRPSCARSVSGRLALQHLAQRSQRLLQAIREMAHARSPRRPPRPRARAASRSPVRARCRARRGRAAGRRPRVRGGSRASPRARRGGAGSARRAAARRRGARAAAGRRSGTPRAGRRDPRGSGCSATSAVSERLVAATTRTSILRERAPPTGRTSRSCSARSSLAWSDGEVSPISSRKSVPPSAASKRPGLSRSAPVKRAARVPEELALEQRVRERGAVHRDEGCAPARAALVDRAREHLLAASRLAREQHRRVRRSRRARPARARRASPASARSADVRGGSAGTGASASPSRPREELGEQACGAAARSRDRP